jgi:hypothetical protein
VDGVCRRRSVEEMDRKVGDTFAAVTKFTEIKLQKE